MSGTYKLTEIVGTSTVSFAEAVKDGVKKSVENLAQFELVPSCRGTRSDQRRTSC